MNRFLLSLILSLLILAALFPAASAAVKTTTVATTATVPPVLKACSKPAVPLAALTCAFPADPASPAPDGPPYTAACFDLSYTEPGQDIQLWEWDFGDGTTGNLRNAVHSYTGAGKFRVNLTVTTLCGRQYANSTSTVVTVYCTVPEPGFSTNVTEGPAPLAVRVTDTSQRTPANVTTWTYWLDNSPASNEKNPVFTFDVPGTYTISQTVWKDCVQSGSAPLPPFSRTIVVNAGSAASNATPVTPVPTTAAVPASLQPTVSRTPAAVTATATTPVESSTGTLSVSTSPSGAQVYVDEILQGASPVMVGLAEGSHTLRITMDGYNTSSAPVLIAPGKTTEYSTTLSPASGGGGVALVPMIALGVIVIIVIGAGLVLYRRNREA